MYYLLAPLYNFFLDIENNFTYDEIMFNEGGYSIVLTILLAIPLASYFLFYRVLDIVVAKRSHFYIAVVVVTIAIIGTTFGCLFQFTSLVDYQDATPEYHANVEAWVLKASVLTGLYGLFSIQVLSAFVFRFISINNRYNPF